MLLICIGIIIIIVVTNQRLNKEIESLTNRPAVSPQPVSQDLQAPAQPSKRKPVVLNPQTDPLAPMAQETSVSPQKSQPASQQTKPTKTYEKPLEEDILIQ